MGTFQIRAKASLMRLVDSVIEELLACNFVVLDGVDPHFLKRGPLAGGLGGDFEGEMDGKLARAAEVRAKNFPAVNCVVASPNFGLLDDRLLARGLFSATFDGDDVGGIHRAHDVEVLAFVTQIYELSANGLNTHVHALSGILFVLLLSILNTNS